MRLTINHMTSWKMISMKLGRVLAMSGLVLAIAAGQALMPTMAEAADSKVPSRPEELVFPELSFDMPDAGSMRFELSNGTPVYALEDHQLPLVSLSLLMRGGRYLQPQGKEGLAAITSEVWRSGGAGDRSAKELDEELDLLAAELSTSINEVTSVVELDVMSKDLEAAMAALMDVVTAPSFQDDRFSKAKDNLIQDMKTRNDSSAAIEQREWRRLIYGDDYWMNRLSTKASVESLTAEDCKRFVSSLARSGNVIVAVSGDFEQKAMLDLLERTIGTLPGLESPVPAVPQPGFTPTPGVYTVDKPDVNQGRVRFGHIGQRLGHSAEMALTVGSYILGGGGFTARAMKRVRSDEGLAYGAYTDMDFPVTFPGTFASYFQSKSSTVAYATEIFLGLIDDMRAAPVTTEELETAQAFFIETFPRTFQSASQTVSRFAVDELLGRPEGYWASYRDRIEAVDAAAVQTAFTKEISPESMVFLVVGNIEEILAGHKDHGASLEKLGGEIIRVPLRDPLTLEPLAE